MNIRKKLLSMIAIPPLMLTACSESSEEPQTQTSTTKQSESKTKPSTTPPSSATETSPPETVPSSESATYGLTDEDLQIIRNKCDFLKQSPCTDTEVAQYSQLWINNGTKPQPGEESKYDSYDQWIDSLTAPEPATEEPAMTDPTLSNGVVNEDAITDMFWDCMDAGGTADTCRQ